MMKAIFLIFYVTCCFSFTSSFSGLSGLSDGSSSSKTKNQNVWILTSLYRELEKCMLLLIFLQQYAKLLSFAIIPDESNDVNQLKEGIEDVLQTIIRESSMKFKTPQKSNRVKPFIRM